MNTFFTKIPQLILLGTTQEDEEELKAINNHFAPSISEFLDIYQSTTDKTKRELRENDYLYVMRRRNAKIEEVYNKAKKRELDYFSTHIDELFDKIKSYAEKDITAIQQGQKTIDKWLIELYKDEKDEVKKYIFISGLVHHIIILWEKAPERYEEIINFIEEALKRKHEQNKPVTRTKTHKANKFILDRTKVNQAIREGKENLYSEKGLLVKTGHTGSKNNSKPIYTPVALNYIFDELENQGLSVNIIGYLKAVDMVYAMHLDSFHYAGNNKVTYDMLATQMSGGRRKQATSNFIELTKESLKRLRHYDIEIDTGAEYKAHFNKQTVFSGVMLPNKIKLEPIMLNGKIVEEYIHILDHSVMSEYADSKNQISRPPIAMFDVPLSLTEDNIVLTHYLLDRIIDMQSPTPKKGKYIIKYDTLFEYLGINDKKETEHPKKTQAQMLRNKKNKIREAVRKILKTWKKKGFIKNFEELTENDTPAKGRVPIAKIKITLPPKQEEIKTLTEKSV